MPNIVDVKIIIDVALEMGEGKAIGTVTCGDRKCTIRDGRMAYKGFDQMPDTEVDLPYGLDAIQAVGFAMGNMFGDIDPEWALRQSLQMVTNLVGNTDMDTIGNA
ncbi:MAG: hypothetical protein KAJ55_13310 [Anaerolineales bacterium]|nr:hypothetical protein [Anaerolineales bacterium]